MIQIRVTDIDLDLLRLLLTFPHLLYLELNFYNIPNFLEYIELVNESKIQELTITSASSSSPLDIVANLDTIIKMSENFHDQF